MKDDLSLYSIVYNSISQDYRPKKVNLLLCNSEDRKSDCRVSGCAIYLSASSEKASVIGSLPVTAL